MRKLRLYREEPRHAVDLSESREVDHACKLCNLHTGRHTVCVPADGSVGPNTLMVVGDGPTSTDDMHGRPFTDKYGMWLRDQIATLWKGPVVYDLATRCSRGTRELTDVHLRECRPYLAATLREANPSRVLILGADASVGMLGRRISINSVRRPYGFFYNLPGDEPVPFYVLPHLAACALNYYVRRTFLEDLRWALTEPPPPPPPTHLAVELCRSERDYAEAAEACMQAAWGYFDVETAGPACMPGFRMLSLAVTLPNLRTFQWDQEAVAEALRPGQPLRRWFESPEFEKRGHYVNYDAIALELVNRVRTRGGGRDSRVWHRLLKADAPSAKLVHCVEMVGLGGAKEEMDGLLKEATQPLIKALNSWKKQESRERENLGYRPSKATLAHRATYEAVRREDPEIAQWAAEGRDAKQWGLALVPPGDVARYNARDTVAGAILSMKLEQELAARPDMDAFRRAVVDPAEEGLALVQRWGVPVSKPRVMAFDAYLTTKLEPVERFFESEGVNPNSPDDVAEWLYVKKKIKPTKLLDSGTGSTDAESLESIKADNPDVQRVLDFRRFSGFRTKYARGMLIAVTPDGRVHPSIWVDGAQTGRSSVSDPPLQQIPKSKASIEGQMARGCFMAEPGHKILSLDYKQLEICVAALLANDEAMIEILRTGADFHQRTAELICEAVWHIPASELKPFHREQAKTMNFSMLYGAGDESVAAKLRTAAIRGGLSPAEVESVTVQMVADVRGAVLSKFTGLARFILESEDMVRKTGEVRTWWAGKPARRRPLWDIGESTNNWVARSKQNKALRAATNTRVQGTANDFQLASLATLVQWILGSNLERDVQLILPVHDQLLFHVRDSHVKQTIDMARDVMQSHDSGRVPLTVDVELGQSWGELQKWDAEKWAA